MREALPLRSARICWGGEGFKHRVVEEVRERSVANVVQQAGNAERFDNESFTWGRCSVAC